MSSNEMRAPDPDDLGPIGDELVRLLKAAYEVARRGEDLHDGTGGTRALLVPAGSRRNCEMGGRRMTENEQEPYVGENTDSLYTQCIGMAKIQIELCLPEEAKKWFEAAEAAQLRPNTSRRDRAFERVRNQTHAGSQAGYEEYLLRAISAYEAELAADLEDKDTIIRAQATVNGLYATSQFPPKVSDSAMRAAIRVAVFGGSNDEG